VAVSYLHDAIGGKIEEFTFTQAGAEKRNATEPSKQVRMAPGSSKEASGAFLIQEAWPRGVGRWDIPLKDEVGIWRLFPFPLSDTAEEVA